MGTAIDATRVVSRSGNDMERVLEFLSIAGTQRHLMIDDQDAFLVCWLGFRSTFVEKSRIFAVRAMNRIMGWGEMKNFKIPGQMTVRGC